jgi:hypothetical protein
VELRDTPLSVWRTGKSAKARHAHYLSRPLIRWSPPVG